MEIKFRAMINKTGEIVKVKGLDIENKIISYYVEGEQGQPELTYESMDDVTLMQYTGRKCDKGNELYQGDVVHIMGFEEHIDTGVGVKSEFTYKDKIVIHAAHSLLAIEEYGEKVVLLGNIYDNPELIEEVKLYRAPLMGMTSIDNFEELLEEYIKEHPLDEALKEYGLW